MENCFRLELRVLSSQSFNMSAIRSFKPTQINSFHFRSFSDSRFTRVPRLKIFRFLPQVYSMCTQSTQSTRTVSFHFFGFFSCLFHILVSLILFYVHFVLFFHKGFKTFLSCIRNISLFLGFLSIWFILNIPVFSLFFLRAPRQHHLVDGTRELNPLLRCARGDLLSSKQETSKFLKN